MKQRCCLETCVQLINSLQKRIKAITPIHVSAFFFVGASLRFNIMEAPRYDGMPLYKVNMDGGNFMKGILWSEEGRQEQRREDVCYANMAK